MSRRLGLPLDAMLTLPVAFFVFVWIVLVTHRWVVATCYRTA
eukprot:COSAG05_NODE_7_length_42457_cov_58.929152_5_plen_42_part_00